MDATLAPAVRCLPVRGLALSLREWPAPGQPFLLVHGLASNACTWDGVAARLQAAGHHVVAVDQRGHGRSDKPETGYGFDEVTADLKALIETLDLERPVIAGQSWGGNVALDFAARWPQLLRGLVLVDGGFIELSAAPGATWEQIAIDLKPPPLAGTPRVDMLERLRGFHPQWPEAALEMQMANFETLPDGTVRPWLTLDRHMQILRSLWEQKPTEVYARASAPTLIAVADARNRDRHDHKEAAVAAAAAALPQSSLRWFTDTAHDIHVHRPDALADWILEALEEGFFGREAGASA